MCTPVETHGRASLREDVYGLLLIGIKYRGRYPLKKFIRIVAVVLMFLNIAAIHVERDFWQEVILHTWTPGDQYDYLDDPNDTAGWVYSFGDDYVEDIC